MRLAIQQRALIGQPSCPLRVAWSAICLLLVLLNWPITPASAHPEGFSGLHVTIAGDRTRVALTLHTRDLGNWFPPGKYPNYVSDVLRELESSARELIELQVDGEPVPVLGVEAFEQEVGLLEVGVDLELPAFSDPVELLIWSKHLIHLPRGHQQLVFVEDRRDLSEGAAQGIVRLEDALTAERDAAAVTLPPVQTARPAVATVPGTVRRSEQPNAHPRRPTVAASSGHAGARISFFRIGIEHILTGYDHLLFLAALLLTCTRFREAAAIITCFTLAHSVTLALAALDFVRLPGSVVEPAIALSIVYVATENLVGTPRLGRRAAITCLFGLVHGLGFAAALQSIGLGTLPGGVLMPLLKFNLGVEAGQLCVAVILLPLFLRARRDEQRAKRFVLAGSSLVALAGGYWLVTRVMSQFLSS